MKLNYLKRCLSSINVGIERHCERGTSEAISIQQDCFGREKRPRNDARHLIFRAMCVFLLATMSMCFIANNTFAAASFQGATVSSEQTICSGSTPTQLTLSITTCPGALSAYTISAYEWQASSNNTTWAKAIGGTGVTSSAYTPPALTSTKYYRCKITVSGVCALVTSPYSTASVKITVNAATSISTNPSAQAVCLGSTATFSVVAAGASLTYQWQNCKTATGTYTDVSGATSANYSLTATTANNGYYYKCKVSGSCGAAKTSAYARLTLNTNTSITTQPSSQTVCSGSTATFSVVAKGSSLTYQWQWCATETGTFSNILGATSSSYSVSGASDINGYYYKCVVTGACSSVISSAAGITVNDNTSITTNPSNQSACLGSTATFNVVATGNSLTYQWQYCSTETGTYSNIPEATSSSHSLTATAAKSGNYYKCEVSGTCGLSQTSTAAKLALSKSANITTQPAHTTVLEGRSTSFSVEAIGSGLTYQWQRCETSDGTFSNLSGLLSTLSTYLLSPSSADNGYYYRCQITGSCGAENSEAALLTVATPFSDTLTLTQSDLATNHTEYYDRLDYTGLTNALQKATLNVLLDLGDNYSLGSAPSYSASLTVTVTGYDASGIAGSSTSKTITLTGTSTSIETDKLAIINLNPDYADVDFYSISYVLASGAPSKLRVKTWVDEEYNYDVNSGDYSSKTLLDISSPSITGSTATFSWTSDYESNNHYQLQVLRLYNQSETKNKDAEYLYNNDIDWSRALSIEVEDATSVSLYMAEGTGYYAWRVRPIGNYYEGGIANSLNWGVWSDHNIVADERDYFSSTIFRSTFASAVTFTSSAVTPDYVFYVEQADADKYWIFNRAFTESNSIAQGISYATGLGQVKQNQRLLQEQDSILVNQAAYDYCGRQAIQTLTAPYTQSYLGYVETLIKDSTKSLYGPDDFDTEERVQFPDDLGEVPVWENPLPIFGAINQFYSDTNVDLSIPNAGNFPYARTLYHQDGRVKKQSLFGDEHRMGLYDKTYDAGGLQRTIRTYYSAVSDSELLKVFGNETPHDTNMYKIITVDPNERPFVEYKTIDGKTIATAYINTGQHPLVDDIWEDPSIRIKKIIEGEVMSDPNTIVREQCIAFAEPTVQVNLKYWIDASDDIFNANCVNYCRTCDYSIYLYIIREETDELKWDKTYTVGADGCSSSKDFEVENLKPITLSDPGVYRFGRKITVNGLYNGEKHYSEYHDSLIGKKMDENVLSQYDDLVAYLQGTAVDAEGKIVTTNLDDLNTYLDFLAGISTTASSLPDLLNDTKIDVSYDATNDEYTISNNCSEVVIPKVSCDEDVCSDYWIDYGATTTDIDNDGTVDYDATVADLFKDDKGYYDFESLLFSKAEEKGCVDAGGTAIGDNICQYFYDQYGAQIYQTNNWYSEAAIYIKAEEFHTDGGGWDYAGQTITIKLPDPDDLTTKTTLYQNEFEDNCNTNSSDRDIIYDLIGYGVKTSTQLETNFDCGDIDLEDTHNSGDFTNRYCSSGSSEYYFTGAQLAKSIYYTIQNAYASIDGIDVSMGEKTSDGYYKITIKVDHEASFALADVAGKLSLSLALHEPETDADKNYVTSEDFELHEPTGEFMYGNGALNAMLNHMILDEEDESAYNCIDIMTAMEQFASDWQGLYATKGSTELPGINFMDYFLSVIGSLEYEEEDENQSNGKQYVGFSDHPYGKGDENAFLETGLTGDYTNPISGSTSTDYGYGYLEYAYKSFQLDWQMDYLYSKYKDTHGYGGDYEQIDNCIGQYGITLTTSINNWTNPTGESLTDTNFVYDTATCGTAAWWDGSDVIADLRTEATECKVWEQLATCLQTDIEQVSETTGLEDTDGDGNYANEMESMVTTKMTSMYGLRGMALANIIADKDDALDSTEVILAKDKLDTRLIANYLTTSNLSSSNKATRLQALLDAQRLVSGKIDLTFNTAAGSAYTFLSAIKTTKGAILAAALKEKTDDCGCSPTRSNLKGWITEIADEKKINISATSPLKLVSDTTFFNATTALGTKSATFSVSGGKLQFNDGATTHTLMNVSNTTGGNQIYEVPPLGYTLAAQSPITAGVSLQRFKKKDCNQDNIDYLLFMLESELAQARQIEIDSSLANYYEKCTLPSNIIDTLIIEYGVDYVHFTLFYYDINGNLIKTVPPKGVDVWDYYTDVDTIVDTLPSRMNVKNHTLTTEYRYNSLGQKVYESTPDGGETEFWYNKVGQIRFSKNAKQIADNTFSYIKYDALGRPIESGECSGLLLNPLEDEVDDSDFPTKNNSYKTVTVYNDAVSGLSYLNSEELVQEYLQNRVSYSYTDADGTTDNGDEIYTYFSYSPHGMVEWMLQSIPGLDNKYIEYEYDLISGKVTQLSYNPGKADQFFHKYVYDSDNRIQKVQTSRDGYLWDTDAEYKYYAYGPLKRVSLGEDKVQGLDYTYTINGWLKGVNHQSLSASYDPGGDGSSSSSFAKDVFGYSLGYFEGDFKRGYDSDANGSLDTYSPFNSEFSDATSAYNGKGKNQMDWYRDGGSQTFNYKPLFDGTITNMVYNVKDPSGSMNHSEVPQGFVFNYDELNRLTKASYDYSSGNSASATFNQNTKNEYLSTFSYDENGNIDTLSRYANLVAKTGLVTQMDSLFYHYTKTTNQLSRVQETAGATAFITTDIENQGPANYDYDEIGQLIADNAEGIETISWTPAHKVEKVTFSSGKIIKFTYNSLGHRTSKTVVEPSGTTFTVATTYYVTDANGSVMAIYSSPIKGADASLTELPIHASSRIGEYKPATAIDPDDAVREDEFTRTVGSKYYEMTDHLGNVRAVVKDVKATDGSATVASATDYYPYGMEMPERSYSSSDYRYGYQGKEKDDDIKSNGNSYDFGARFYDPRLGRWLSLDPLTAKFPSESPYSAMGNNPINMVDPDGKAAYSAEKFGELVEKGKTLSEMEAHLNALDNVKFAGTVRDKDGAEIGKVFKVKMENGDYFHMRLMQGKTVQVEVKGSSLNYSQLARVDFHKESGLSKDANGKWIQGDWVNSSGQSLSKLSKDEQLRGAHHFVREEGEEVSAFLARNATLRGFAGTGIHTLSKGMKYLPLLGLVVSGCSPHQDFSDSDVQRGLWMAMGEIGYGPIDLQTLYENKEDIAHAYDNPCEGFFDEGVLQILEALDGVSGGYTENEFYDECR